MPQQVKMRATLLAQARHTSTGAGGGVGGNTTGRSKVFFEPKTLAGKRPAVSSVDCHR